MKYFENFPKIITSEPNGNSNLSTNLMTRVNIVPKLLNNPALYYKYSLQDGDTPEIMSTKYYDSPDRYWIVLFGNDRIVDPQWDMGLSYINFNAYLNDKYGSAAKANNQTTLEYTQSTVKYYRKLLITTDSVSNETTTNAFNVDYDTYQTLPENLVSTNYFSDGSSVTTTISKDTISIYDYENDLNESSKQVNIIDKKYVMDMETKLKSTLGE